MSESASLVQTESGAVSTVVNQQAIQELPNDGRQLQNLALIVPGVSAGLESLNGLQSQLLWQGAQENTEQRFQRHHGASAAG